MSAERGVKFVRAAGVPLYCKKSEDGSHALLTVRIGDQNYGISVNVHSKDGSDVQYCFVELEDSGILRPKFQEENVGFKYTGVSLHQEQFETVSEEFMYNTILKNFTDCELVMAFGFKYQDGPNVVGVHDVHYNNGEPKDSKWKNHPNQDGAICFFKKGIVSWVFIKFATQVL